MVFNMAMTVWAPNDIGVSAQTNTGFTAGPNRTAVATVISSVWWVPHTSSPLDGMQIFSGTTKSTWRGALHSASGAQPPVSAISKSISDFVKSTRPRTALVRRGQGRSPCPAAGRTQCHSLPVVRPVRAKRRRTVSFTGWKSSAVSKYVSSPSQPSGDEALDAGSKTGRESRRPVAIDPKAC